MPWPPATMTRYWRTCADSSRAKTCCSFSISASLPCSTWSPMTVRESVDMAGHSEALEHFGCESLARWAARGWRHKGSDLRDGGAVEGEDVERFRRVPLLLGFPAVVAERQLPVGANGNEAPRIAQRETHEEGSDRVPSAIPGREGRHGERGVVGEHGEDRVDVRAFPRVDVPLNEFANAVVTESAQGCLLAP